MTYLLGAVPFGLLLARRLAGIDVREHGSNNIGATNVARVAGKALGLATLALDVAKGLGPTLGAAWLFEHPWQPQVVALAAVVGHCWPIWLRFKGGKGVATSAGVLLALTPWATLVAAGVWIGTFALSRKSSLAALVALVAIQGAVWFFTPELIGLSAALAVVLLVCHRPNIRRLLRREELDV